jgi:hypothetical protein
LIVEDRNSGIKKSPEPFTNNNNVSKQTHSAAGGAKKLSDHEKRLELASQMLEE